MVARKHLRLECQWVKPHGDGHPEFFIQYDLDVEDCFGNCCVGRLALSAAKVAEIPHEVAAPVLQMISYVQLIQQRLVAILLELVA